MAKKKATKKKTTKKKTAKQPDTVDFGFTGKKLVEFNHDVRGMPCRCRGQRVWLTPELAKRQGLKPGDFHLVKR